MKNTFIKIKSIFLALAILFASNSYAITSHFCGEELIAISFFGNDVSCAIETTGDDCDDEASVVKECCSNITTLIEAEEFNATVYYTADKQFGTLTVTFSQSYIDFFRKRVIHEKDYYKDFSPPDVEQDIRILHQTFLI